MDSLPDDDWFDKVMLTVSNYAKPVSEEWFKLMEWFLIISALGFGAQKTNDTMLQVLLLLSVIFLWLRLFVAYSAVWHDRHQELLTIWQVAPSQFIRILVHAAGMLVITLLTSVVSIIAWRFAKELAQLMKS